MWILLGMILIMPFEKNPYLKISSSFLGIIPEFTMIKLLGMIGFVWVCCRVFSGQRIMGNLVLRQHLVFILFFCVVLFAGLVSGTGHVTVARYVSLALFLPIILTAVNDERKIRQVLWSCVGIMILVFPYALRQFLRYDGRWGVGLYEANYLALALVVLIPISCVITLQQIGSIKRAFWFTGTGLLIISLIMTGSRGGFLGVVVSLGLLTFRLARRPFMVTGLVVVGLIAFVLVVPTGLGQRLLASGLDPSVQSTSVKSSTQARFELLQAGLRMVADKPMFGVGLGNFKQLSSEYYDVKQNRIAHNTYLQIAAESGLPALAMFLLFLVLVFCSLSKSARLALDQDHLHIYEWVMALQAGLMGFLTAAFFLSAQFEKFFWLIVFLSMALERFLVAEADALDWGDTPDEDDVIEEPAWTRWSLPGSSGVR